MKDKHTITKKLFDLFIEQSPYNLVFISNLTVPLCN